ncbi:hypothetical protein NliqN6_5394 [Naganishia liquefaciens]|uniref:Glycoside hydrolase family 31 N-terminal domain-containing protein n=1 Tax=Naganishia liquefaciens TaxID=104408 RepID=A0A8H3YI99_9TREE|nr:hypothetical protein NliqN6_5394 [Naganishia liquefaciens]
MFERLLEDFDVKDISQDAIALVNKQGYTYELTLASSFPPILHTTLTGPERPRPPQSNIISPEHWKAPLPASLRHEKGSKIVTFELADGKKVTLDYSSDIHLRVTESLVNEDGEQDDERLVFGTVPRRGYVLGEHGMIRYSRLIEGNLHVGLGEKGAPLDLTGRLFELTGTDAAAYDAYDTDPLYKHTPYLISLAKPYKTDFGVVQPASYAQYQTSNSDGTWDIHHKRSDPQGYFSRYSQDWGGLDEYLIFDSPCGRANEAESLTNGVNAEWKTEKEALDLQRTSANATAGLRYFTRTFAEMVGKPLLVPRDWLGYLASGMGLGESDEPRAQSLLEQWPEMCRENDIPCSGMHLSSGYTVGEEDGNRYVFTMNKKRYPDFKAMAATFHRAGIKIAPNIKPYLLSTHPDYKKLEAAGALFKDPFYDPPATVTTSIWSSGVGSSEKGSWSDMTSAATRKWWHDGVKSLVEIGCDAMWNDNNEYLLHNDTYLAEGDEESRPRNAPQGPIQVGLLGRMYHTELMGKISHDTCVEMHPDRRPFVLTRSGNVGTFKYAASTWSGDNYTSWKTLQGSVAMGLNAGLSLIQCYGTDVGGFAGPLPSPELFVRWVQFGCVNQRFCIHSFKPNKKDPSGAKATNMPWMYPEVTPMVRKAIKRRYELLPFFNSLNWESHLHAEPPNSWLGHGEFGRDYNLYTDEILNGFDFWLGTGRLLVAGAYFPGQTSKTVYFPQTNPEDKTPYIRVSQDPHAKTQKFSAGTTAQVDIPLNEFAIFARAGTVLPIGKDHATVTALSGIARTAVDGVEVVLKEDGGMVSLDDWRGVEIYPPTGSEASACVGQGTWIEDDGASRVPKTTIVRVEYSASTDSVKVSAKFTKRDFDVAWGSDLWVVLPPGDDRKVQDATEGKDSHGRRAWRIQVV